jgi:tetratricopeptide (TPR) repeat protein
MWSKCVYKYTHINGSFIMPTDPAPAMSLGVSESRPGPDARTPRHSTAPSRRRGRRWRRPFAIAAGLIVALLLGAFAWSELYPTALAQADAAYGRNDLETTLRIAKAHLARRPFSRRAALLAARSLSRLGRPDQAEPYYQQAGSLDFEDRHIRAYALVVNNRREPAIQAYREILASRPDDVLALSRMAAVLISEARWGEAIAAANRLIEIPAGAVLGHTLAGVVYHNTFESDLAVFQFDRVLELDPELKRMPLKPRSMFWIDYGHSLLSVGRWADARRHLEHAFGEGDDAQVADLLGQSYYLEGAFDDAKRCWRQAILWDPDRFGTWLRIGTLELQQGQATLAVEPLRRAMALQPLAIGPLYNLSLALRRLGQTEEAERLVAQVKRLRGEAASSPSGATEPGSPRPE